VCCSFSHCDVLDHSKLSSVLALVAACGRPCTSRFSFFFAAAGVLLTALASIRPPGVCPDFVFSLVIHGAGFDSQTRRFSVVTGRIRFRPVFGSSIAPSSLEDSSARMGFNLTVDAWDLFCHLDPSCLFFGFRFSLCPSQDPLLRVLVRPIYSNYIDKFY
jgi:hypothetical protein